MNATNLTGGQLDLPDDSFHRLFLSQSRFWVQRVLVPAVMTVGVVGNVVTIVIMTRRRMRSSTNHYLAALAIFDIMYLVITFVLSLSHYPRIPDADHLVYWRLLPFVYMLTDASSNASVWLTVTFTVERYVAVCHPMRGKVFCTESRAKKAIVAVFFFCFAFTIPTPFEWKVVEHVNSETNRTTLYLDYSEMGRNAVYRNVYYWLTVVLFILLPFLLLAVFNSFLIRSVHLSKAQRSSMTRTEENCSQENRITIMLIAVVILFFVCQLPTAAHLLYSTLGDDRLDERQRLLLRGLGNIFNFLMSLNAAGNFVLYCLLSQKYRKTFVQIFCPCAREGRGARMLSSSACYYQSTTVCTSADNDSPGSSCSRRMNRLSSSPTRMGSGSDMRRSSGGGDTNVGSGGRTAFLQVPNSAATKVVYDDDDVDSMDGHRTTTCARWHKVLRSPWRRIRKSMGIEGKSATREQVIPLKGTGNKCIVITAPEIMSPTTQWSPNSTV